MTFSKLSHHWQIYIIEDQKLVKHMLVRLFCCDAILKNKAKGTKVLNDFKIAVNY